MTVVQKSIGGFVSDSIATWAAQTGTSPVFSDGDPLLAFWQSIAVQLDFLQAQTQLVLAMSRAQTASGADLDSWMAQFGFSRLASTFATGGETFQRLTPASSQITVPVGAIVQTVGGGVQFAVVADLDEPAWSIAANGYVLPVGQTSLVATIEALVAGPSGNVLSNTVTQFGSSIPGIDQVTNAAPISNGIAGETDQAFRARFNLYLATLAKATRSAILAAATGVQQGLLISLLENQQPNGTPLLGSFTVVVDDGSGNPPTSLLNAVFNAVDQTRAFSVQPFVVPPTSVLATITLAINLAAGANAVTVNAAAQNAVAAIVNGLAPGARLNGSSIITAALSVAGVAAVNPSSVTINGGSADLIPTIQQEVRTTTLLVSVTNY